MWSIEDPKRQYFTISSRHTSKVLDAADSSKIHMYDYHGKDNQVWFFDENSIRSKKYPDKVIDLHMSDYKNSNDGWGKIYLNDYHGGENQRWKIGGDKILSLHQDLPLNIKGQRTHDGALVGCYKKTSAFNINELWSINSDKREYFMIYSKDSTKVVDAASSKKIHLHEAHGKDNQLWFWDGSSLRSKRYSDKVIDFHMRDFEKSADRWGKIYLHPYHGGDNQQWSFDGSHLLSYHNELPLNIHGGKISNEAKIGCYKKRGKYSHNELWTLSAPMKPSSNAKGCGNKVEQDIYSVVQWIPFLSTLWDAISGIAYASANCLSVAEERGKSFGIGLAMDIATAVSFGGLAVAGQGVKTGVKAAVKLGVKEAFKQSLKAVPGKIAKIASKLGIKNLSKKLSAEAIESSIKKASKFFAKEVVLDDLNLYKAIGKFVKSPVKSTKQIGKALGGAVEDVKNIKNFNIKEWAEKSDILAKNIDDVVEDVATAQNKNLAKNIDDVVNDVAQTQNKNLAKNIDDVVEDVAQTQNKNLIDKLCRRKRSPVKGKRKICAVTDPEASVVKRTRKWEVEDGIIKWEKGPGVFETWKMSTPDIDPNLNKLIVINPLIDDVANRNAIRITLQNTNGIAEKKMMVVMCNPSTSSLSNVDSTMQNLIDVAVKKK